MGLMPVLCKLRYLSWSRHAVKLKRKMNERYFLAPASSQILSNVRCCNQVARANQLEIALAHARSDLDTASCLAEQVRKADKEKSDVVKKLNELVALLSITDSKLQQALASADAAHIRCALLDEELSHATQELEARRQVTAVSSHDRNSADVQTDLTVAFLDADYRKTVQIQNELADALQEAAASRAAFSALTRSSSVSVLDANDKMKQEWAQWIEELRQVTLFPHFQSCYYFRT